MIGTEEVAPPLPVSFTATDAVPPARLALGRLEPASADPVQFAQHRKNSDEHEKQQGNL